MLRRLIRFLLGYLRLEIVRGDFNGFLQAAVGADISLWDVMHRQGRLLVSVSLGDFWRLRPIFRACRCRVRIRRRAGLPFRWMRLRRRPVLLLGAAACVAFLMWATSHVWVVQVRINGPQVLDTRAVRQVAAEAGLKAGVWKRDVDIHAIQAHLMKRLGEVSWAGVRVQGTRVVIDVVEKAGQTPARQDACINIYAEKAGVIEQVIPFRGEAKVKRGDVVRPGDLLVECALRYWAGGRPQVYPGTPVPPREDLARIVVANASVKARVQYQEYREIPLYRDVPQPTGQTATRWVLKWKEKSIILRGSETFPFEEYEVQQRSYGSNTWRNWFPPVEFVMLTAEEVTHWRERLSAETAVMDATQQLTAQLRWALGPNDKLLLPAKGQLVERTDEYAGVRLTAETLEEIGAPREGQVFVAPPAPVRP